MNGRLIASQKHQPAWEKHSRDLKGFYLSLGFIFCFACISALLNIPWLVVISLCVAPVYFSWSHRSFRCPRCGDRFYGTRFSYAPRTTCRHCGLPYGE